MTETATVTAIDPATRLVSLETADGEELAVEAGEDVRNFDQIEVGDDVNVVYHASLAAEVTQAPPSDSDEAVVVKTVRAPEGQRPGGGAGMVYTVAVTVDAVEDNSILFTGPSGVQREVMAERPEVQEFIAKLEPGDRVQVTFGEAMAIAISPAQDPAESPAER